MPYELCRHIKANGTTCKAPCVTDSFWCYFHARMHFRHRAIREAKATVATSPLILPVLEDRESIQVAASLVACALALGRIDEKRASTILKALALSARNLTRRLDTEPMPNTVARSYTPTLDGLDLAPRQMSDNSTPPPYPPRQIVQPETGP